MEDKTNTFHLILAPPAWGKTHKLFSMIKKGKHHWIFLSPLRALAEEVAAKDQALSISTHSVSKQDCKKQLKAFFARPSGLFISTVESFCFDTFDNFKDFPVTFIFDEFHLFYKWGLDFRPQLLEALYQVANMKANVLGLTATANTELLQFVETDLTLGFDQVEIENFGNQTLKYWPHKYYLYHPYFSRSLVKRFERELLLKESGCFLFFCEYRAQVHLMKARYQALGFKALGCVGGEVAHFLADLKETPSPDIIFSTTVLSHGVNLPTPTKIFFGYPVADKDFWIQMCGRGGRKGERYQVFTYDAYVIPGRIKKSRHYLSTFLSDQLASLLTLFSNQH